MTEVEVQQRAKRYLDCLVQGINPWTAQSSRKETPSGRYALPGACNMSPASWNR